MLNPLLSCQNGQRPFDVIITRGFVSLNPFTPTSESDHALVAAVRKFIGSGMLGYKYCNLVRGKDFNAMNDLCRDNTVMMLGKLKVNDIIRACEMYHRTSNFIHEIYFSFIGTISRFYFLTQLCKAARR